MSIKSLQGRRELRRHFFSERVVNRWNSLKQATVEAAEVNSFKRLLDKERLTRIHGLTSTGLWSNGFIPVAQQVITGK